MQKKLATPAAPSGREPRRDGGHTTLQRRPQKTAVLLAQRIVSDITKPNLPPGSPLPSERQMLEQYGVARGTLREALRYLEVHGVLTIKPGPGGGPVVNGVDPRSLANAIAMLLQLSRAPFSTVLEARQVLEPGSARDAATRIDEDGLSELRASIEAMQAVVDDPDPEAFLLENRTFHQIIARASGNQLFELLLGSLGWIIDATALGVQYDPRRRKVIVAAHRTIYEALAARDPDAAHAAMQAHMDTFARYMNRYYKNELQQVIRWDVGVLQ